MEDKSRVIVRLSGTGTKGATLRIYFERYAPNTNNEELNRESQDALCDLIKDINNLGQIHKRTGMNKPTVIT